MLFSCLNQYFNSILTQHRLCRNTVLSSRDRKTAHASPFWSIRLLLPFFPFLGVVQSMVKNKKERNTIPPLCIYLKKKGKNPSFPPYLLNPRGGNEPYWITVLYPSQLFLKCNTNAAVYPSVYPDIS